MLSIIYLLAISCTKIKISMIQVLMVSD